MPSPYITYSDIQTRLDAQTWRQVFDKDLDGSVTATSAGADKTFIDLCISIAQSVVDTELKEAYPGGLTANGGSVDEVVKGVMVGIALYEAVRYGPLDSTYRQGYLDALASLARYRKANDGARLPNAAGGVPPAKRVTTVQNTVNVNEESSLPYTRIVDGRDNSDF